MIIGVRLSARSVASTRTQRVDAVLVDDVECSVQDDLAVDERHLRASHIIPHLFAVVTAVEDGPHRRYTKH